MRSHTQNKSFLNTGNNKLQGLNYRPLVIAITFALSGAAQAATFTVTNTNNAGAGSLRQAVIDANDAAGADNIVFDAALNNQKITLSTGEIEISDELTITGSITGDVASITIDGDEKSRIFLGTNNASITLENLTVTKGRKTATSADYYSYDPTRRAHGGAIHSNGSLMLNNTIVNNSSAHGEYGGTYEAVHSFGDVTLSNSKVTNNQCHAISGSHLIIKQSEITSNNGSYSALDGSTIDINDSIVSHNTSGGIYGRTSVTLNNSIVSHNSTFGVGGNFITLNDSTVSHNSTYGVRGNFITLNDSTVSHNDSGVISGGGITLNQSTISNNQGFGLSGFDADFTINQSTITNNLQGGIHLQTHHYSTSSSDLTLSNTILSGNTAENIKITKYLGSEDKPITINATNSFFGDDVSKLNGTNIGNVFSNTPKLGKLQGNGGFTPTHLPELGSPVLDVGNNADAILFSHDQRGAGYPRIYNGTIDIGAVERQENNVTPFSLDIDGDFYAKPLTDGLLALRYLFGFTDNTLINNAVDTDANRITAAEIQAFIKTGVDSGKLDIDSSGDVKPLTDGLLVLRYLFNFRGNTLINNAIGNNATRTAAPDIEAYLQSIMPTAR